MVKHHVSTLAMVVFLLLLVFCLSAQSYAGDTKIMKKDVPAAVIKSFEQTYPKAKVNGYGKEVEHGVTYYELETVDGNTKRDLLYTVDGKAVEIEETLSMKDLPEAVAQAFAKESAGARASKIEKTTRGEKVTYEFGMGKGKPEIVIDPSGKVIKEKEEKED